jgi:hypothetical protein
MIDDRDWARLARRVMREVKRRDGVTALEIRHLRRDLMLLYGALQTHLIPNMTLTVHQPHYRRVSIAEVALQGEAV